MKYLIAVEIEAIGPIDDLSDALQAAYDDGADGYFKILVTHAPSYLVLFERDTGQDAEYVNNRLTAGTVPIEQAAMHQLAAELGDGNIGDVARPIIEILLAGDAQCFDFGDGAMEEMAVWEEP